MTMTANAEAADADEAAAAMIGGAETGTGTTSGRATPRISKTATLPMLAATTTGNLVQQTSLKTVATTSSPQTVASAQMTAPTTGRMIVRDGADGAAGAVAAVAAKEIAAMDRAKPHHLRRTVETSTTSRLTPMPPVLDRSPMLAQRQCEKRMEHIPISGPVIGPATGQITGQITSPITGPITGKSPAHSVKRAFGTGHRVARRKTLRQCRHKCQSKCRCQCQCKSKSHLRLSTRTRLRLPQLKQKPWSRLNHRDAATKRIRLSRAWSASS